MFLHYKAANKRYQEASQLTTSLSWIYKSKRQRTDSELAGTKGQVTPMATTEDKTGLCINTTVADTTGLCTNTTITHSTQQVPTVRLRF